MLKWIESIFTMLERNLDSFFAQLVLVCTPSILTSCLSFLKGVYIEFRKSKEKKVFELYCKKESDNFYVCIMFLEILILLAIVILFSLCWAIIVGISYFLGYEAVINKGVETIIIVVTSVAISFHIVKIKWVRKRLLGDKEGKILILSSILIFNIGIASGILGGETKNCSYVFLVLYFVCEIWGLLHFQGRYIKYDFSSIKLYLNGGESITCKDIEKVHGRKKYIIVENEDGDIVLQGDKICKVEYYGAPKFVLIEDIERHILQKIKKFFNRPKRRCGVKQRIRGLLKMIKQKWKCKNMIM